MAALGHGACYLVNSALAEKERRAHLGAPLMTCSSLNYRTDLPSFPTAQKLPRPRQSEVLQYSGWKGNLSVGKDKGLSCFQNFQRIVTVLRRNTARPCDLSESTVTH